MAGHHPWFIFILSPPWPLPSPVSAVPLADNSAATRAEIAGEPGHGSSPSPTPEMKETHGFTENGGAPRNYGPVAIAFTDVLEEDPKQATSAFEKRYSDEVKGLRDGGLNCDEGQPDYLGWQIRRKDATWMPLISQPMVLGLGACEIEEYVSVTLPPALSAATNSSRPLPNSRSPSLTSRRFQLSARGHDHGFDRSQSHRSRCRRSETRRKVARS